MLLRDARAERRDLGRLGTRRTARLEGGGDLGASPRERPQHATGHTCDFGQPVDRLVPLDPKPPCEFGAELGLVDGARVHLVQEQPATIQRAPTTIRATRQVRDQNMRVQLRITSTRGAMPKRGGDEPRRFDPVDTITADTRERSLTLEVTDGRIHGGVMRGSDLATHAGRAERMEKRHRLRRRERRVEPRQLPIRRRHTTTRQRINARQHLVKIAGLDGASETHLGARRADPSARCFARTDVVILHPARDRFEVIRLLPSPKL